jgi:NTE family protein
VVATDLDSGEPVVLKHHRLAPAVRASCSIPGLVTPIRMNGRRLVDGGVSDNLPVSAVRELGANYVIGVDLCQPARRRFLGPLGAGFTSLEILVRQAGGGIHTADCLITPELSGFSYARFSRRAELMARGEKAAEEKLPEIKTLLADP